MFYRRLSHCTSHPTSYSTPRSKAGSLVLLSLVSAAAFAQIPVPPQPVFNAPPEVEQALRARVTEFFQLHVESNFQKAYGMVAEDTKKYYFDNKKNTYKSFRIAGVKFLNSDFTKASVDLECEQVMERREFNGVVIPVPMTTMWKIEDGKWMWYRDPNNLNLTDPNNANLTPMGPSDLSKLNSGATDEQIAARLRELTNPDSIAKMGRQIVGQSGVDKHDVTLARNKPSSAEVTFHNGQSGYITLVLDAGEKMAGFSATLDKVDVPANENAVLKLSYDPPPGARNSPRAMWQPREVRLLVQPFNQSFFVTVRFGSPAAANH